MKIKREVNTLILSNDEVRHLAAAVEMAWEGHDGPDNPYVSLQEQFTRLLGAVNMGIGMEEGAHET